MYVPKCLYAQMGQKNIGKKTQEKQEFLYLSSNYDFF